ncbi:hypothetical protein H257_04617 [Aphanomyces astaci]|uniref:glucan endo-1,3-beta-D-glucosidase n=1 Tax=Aphanomyces astaci TaxID=112090 RepID=W4GUY6_APHAT|nr:hypothetical protein H257_04617 [Aphanomyces astaci]ETV82839.1 hypothetical protein H257_04617 [Aphanomyces astaci]|eukprot:XP_009827510.1 hypothetical protein H257_04617 [Aphanomyces astaci]
MPPSEHHASAVVVTTSSAIVMVTPDVEYKGSSKSTDALHRRRKTRLLQALATGLLVVGAVVGALMISTSLHDASSAHDATVAAANGQVSVCYDSYDSRNMPDHFKRIKERFAGVRTFQTQGAFNHIEVAAQAGLQIYAGIWIQSGNVEGDMAAAVYGAKKYPGTVKAILVGNEELMVGLSASFVIDKVNRMKQLLREAGVSNVPVGSVQMDGSWFGNPGLADVCDVMGVNIHPFFSATDISKTRPIEDLKTRWQNLVNRFGHKSIVVTEAGWPTSGSPLNGHVPSTDTAKQFINDMRDWAAGGGGGDMPAYFMFHDNPSKSMDFEKSFGLAGTDGVWKFDFNGPLQRSPSEVKGVVFVNTANDQVLAAAPLRKVEFHAKWGNDWVWDWSSQWTIRGPLIVTWDDYNKVDLCLDAYEGFNGGTVHLWPCDTANGNQQWNYDGDAKLLRHATHDGFCLDMGNPNGGTPHLWTCHESWDPWVKLQQLEWWTK